MKVKLLLNSIECNNGFNSKMNPLQVSVNDGQQKICGNVFTHVIF
jgi:hypothetical protein